MCIVCTQYMKPYVYSMYIDIRYDALWSDGHHAHESVRGNKLTELVVCLFFSLPFFCTRFHIWDGLLYKLKHTLLQVAYARIKVSHGQQILQTAPNQFAEKLSRTCLKYQEGPAQKHASSFMTHHVFWNPQSCYIYICTKLLVLSLGICARQSC